MSETSSRVRLMANLQAAVAEAVSGTMEERGRGFASYLSACGGQPFNVRCAHYAREASLTTFGFVTIVPRYFAAAK